MNKEIELADRLFNSDCRINVGTMEVTLEEIYQVFKSRYLREQDDLLSETVEKPSDY